MSTLNVNTINAATSGQGVAVDVKNPRSFRNLVINGAMQVAQRGTSSTTNGMHTVDRMNCYWTGTDEAITQAQVDVSADTDPWNAGFRNALKITNGNQSSGAGASDRMQFQYKIEAQDIANSGWDYTNTSSYLTLSYWVKSSVAQNFYGYVRTPDGTGQIYPFETGTLSANTWTKITKQIPGHANITVDNNTGEGLQVNFLVPFLGTDLTASGTSLDTWAAYSSSTRTPDYTSTWWTTNDSTIEVTGLQLEVGSYATDFEHRTYGDELARCQRYCYAHITPDGGSGCSVGIASYYNSSNLFLHVKFPVTMRTSPTVVCTDSSDAFKAFRDGTFDGINEFHVEHSSIINNTCAELRNNSDASGTAGWSASVRKNDANTDTLYFTAEL